MGRAAVRYAFNRLPSAAIYYPRALLGPRHALVPDGVEVPRLEGTAAEVRASARHLARYNKVCGFDGIDRMPISYPHVLAMPLHIALLTHRRFLVRLMGLVHVANEIEQWRPMPAGSAYQLYAWVEGHRDGDRGHEFDVFTEFLDAEGVCWREKSTLLARRAVSGGRAARSVRATLRYERPGEGDAVTSRDIDVPASVGRQYGWVSGDLNPIHVGNWGARMFGFESAVAHGMWSLARSLAGLGEAIGSFPVKASCDFKLPLYLPSKVRLEHWRHDRGLHYVLKDGDSQRPHLAGSVSHA